jgi:hypothetical protein
MKHWKFITINHALMMASLTPLIGLKILLLSLSKKNMSVWGGRM